MHFDNSRSSDLDHSEAGSEAEEVKRSVFEGALCCADWRPEGEGALLFVGSFQHPVVTRPFLKILSHIW